MIRKYHNHKLQTTPWHLEEEPLNHQVVSLGGEFARSLAINIKNPFWKDILISCADFCREVKSEEIKSVLRAQLWFNTHQKMEATCM